MSAAFATPVVATFVASILAMGMSRAPEPWRAPTAYASPSMTVDSVDWKAVESTVGRPSLTQPGDVHRFNFPRSDLHVTIGELTIKPALALGGWVAMKATGSRITAMGDLVLTEAELTPVIVALQNGGIEQTAIHHHLIREMPRVFYMHVHAVGDPMKIARALHDAIGKTAIPAASTTAPASPAAIDLDTAAIAKTLGRAGRVNGGVYQVSVPRAAPVTEHGMTIPPSMGVATAINFQPTGDGKAAITGDFVLTSTEVNPVIRALTSHGIEVVSLHSHMLEESPRLFFMHFWANDAAVKLAGGLRAALDVTKSEKPGVR